MTDVTFDQSDPGAAAPEPEVELEPTQPDQPDEGGQEGEDDELEDFEFEGRKFSVPKSAKEALTKGVMLNADYTKKTQGLAEDRRAYEAEKAATEATFEDRVTLRQMQGQLDALEQAIED